MSDIRERALPVPLFSLRVPHWGSPVRHCNRTVLGIFVNARHLSEDSGRIDCGIVMPIAVSVPPFGFLWW